MSRKIKKWNFWLRRRSHLALLLIGGMILLMLFLNDDVSWKNNIRYQEEIKSLQEEIKACEDSADYHRNRREQLLTGTEDLEKIAREQYRMQKSTEDVYVIK